MKKITITTPFVSTNRLYTTNKNGSRRKTYAGRTAALAIRQEALECIGLQEPLQGDLKVSIDLFFPDKRRRDLDNIKGLIDALNGVMWEDDSMIVDLTIRKFIDAKKPRVEISCNRKK